MIVKLNAGYTRIPEGTHTFVVDAVEDKLSDFGKLVVTFKTEKGLTNNQTYTLYKDVKKGILNEGAITAFSTMARAVLQDDDVDSVEPKELVGKYVQATVVWESYTKQDGSQGSSTKLKNWAYADGFGVKATNEDGELDLDAILG